MNFVQNENAALKLVLHHEAPMTFQSISKKYNDMAILVGSEGGLAPSEIKLALENHFSPIQLGPRILRTETAALVITSVLQFIFGDLG